MLTVNAHMLMISKTVSRIHHLETMNVCTKCCASLVDVTMYHNISENFDLLVSLEEKKEDHQSCQNVSSWDLSVVNFMAIH